DGNAKTYGEGRGILCDPATGKEQRQLVKPPGAQFNSVAFLPDGKSLAGAAYLQPIRIHDTTSGEVTRELSIPTSTWTHVAAAPDGRHLALAQGSLVFIFRLAQPPSSTAR